MYTSGNRVNEQFNLENSYQNLLTELKIKYSFEINLNNLKGFF